MSIRIVRALAVAWVMLAPGVIATAWGQNPAQHPTQTAQPNGQAAQSPDADFIRQAGDDGMAEVELGKLAQTLASDNNVKAFADRMVKDHGMANSELMALAKSKGVMLSSDDSMKHDMRPAPGQADARMPSGPLTNLKGAEFDRAYMARMVDDHEKAVQLFEEESTSGKDAEVKAWAAKTLPTLRTHLSQAKSLRERLNTSQ
ncbi:MAG: DUF4142 domain-containing protein [Vicinamibacterales bacterium]